MITAEFKDGSNKMNVFVGDDGLLHFKINDKTRDIVRLNRGEVYELIGCLELSVGGIKE